MPTFIRLILEFMKTGLFAVGGGLATLPFLREMSVNTGWFTEHDIMNLIAISESTPGAIGINMSTYVGYITSGIGGGIAATLALAFPSIIVIVLVAKALERFKASPIVKGIFSGLRPASTAMIAVAGLSVARLAFLNLSAWTGIASIVQVINWKAILLAAAIWFGLKKFKKHPIVYILFAALIGIVFRF